MAHTTIQAPKHDDRFTGWLLIAIGIYSGLLVTLLSVHILSSGSTQERAIILMADGLILFWVILGGSLTPWLRRWLVPRLTAIFFGWRVRFVLLCTAMALLEVYHSGGPCPGAGYWMKDQLKNYLVFAHRPRRCRSP